VWWDAATDPSPALAAGCLVLAAPPLLAAASVPVVSALVSAATSGSPGLAAGFAGELPQAVHAGLAAAAARAGREALEPAVGAWLWLLARARGRTRSVDAGNGTGATALWLGAATTTGGELVVVEADSALAAPLRRQMAAAGLAMTLRIRDVERVLAAERGLDLVLLDGKPGDRVDQARLAIEALAEDGVVVSRGPALGPIAIAHALLAADPRLACLRPPAGTALVIGVRYAS
jgi:predicted O-methyltransferase YrrM